MTAIRDALERYLIVRRALGTRLQEPATTLGYFVDFLDLQGSKFITTDLALRWACQPKYVPIDDSTCSALSDYANRRNKLYARLQTNSFFVSERGARLTVILTEPYRLCQLSKSTHLLLALSRSDTPKLTPCSVRFGELGGSISFRWYFSGIKAAWGFLPSKSSHAGEFRSRWLL